ncbi:hypothetical protein A5874_001517, partial [Enterococcus faecium]
HPLIFSHLLLHPVSYTHLDVLLKLGIISICFVRNLDLQ